MILLCRAFTPPATSDIVSPGLVEDGIKCGSEKMCYEQRCMSVSSLGFPQCPTGSNGQICSGNGVRLFLKISYNIYLILKIFYRFATMKAIVHALLISLEKHAKTLYVCAI